MVKVSLFKYLNLNVFNIRHNVLMCNIYLEMIIVLSGLNYYFIYYMYTVLVKSFYCWLIWKLTYILSQEDILPK